MVVFLVGFMGCGKSSIGKKLANSTDWKFVDMDNIIESRVSLSISEIFNIKGEAWFRALEREVLNEFVDQKNIIVATGGGVPCFGDNMDIMNQIGHTIYFKVSTENLFGRLKRGRENRPKIKELNDIELLTFIEETLSPREVFYNKASLLIDCDGVTEEYIASHIKSYLSHKLV